MLLAEYREMIRLRPDWVAALNGLAWKLVLAGDRPARDFDEGLVHARKCVALDPKNGEHLNTLALAEYRVHHWDEIAATRSTFSERRVNLRLVCPGPGPRAKG